MRFKIPLENVKKFEAKIATLNKRAVKLNCPAISVTRLETVYIPTKDSESGLEDGNFYEAVIFEVSGETPIINGWDFLGRLDPTPNGNMIMTVPGKEIPAKYGQTGTFCDHCKSDRIRKKLYVFQKGEESIQVGRTCLKDFMGHADPLKVAAWCEMLMDLEDAFEGLSDFGGYGRYVKPLIPVRTLLAVASRIIDKHGYKKSRTTDSTSGELVYFFNRPTHKDQLPEWKKFQEKFKPTDESLEKADKVIEFIKGMGESNYSHNLKVSIENEYVDVWKSGLLASSVWVYDKEVEGKVNKGKVEKKNEHIGDVGQRLELELIFKRCRSIDSDFSDSFYVYNFEDSEGNLFTWFTGKELEVSKDDTVSLRGTVKKHTDYNGRNQTVITRCRVS